jgi:hypothetical protein
VCLAFELILAGLDAQELIPLLSQHCRHVQACWRGFLPLCCFWVPATVPVPPAEGYCLKPDSHGTSICSEYGHLIEFATAWTFPVESSDQAKPQGRESCFSRWRLIWKEILPLLRKARWKMSLLITLSLSHQQSLRRGSTRV